MCHCNPRIRTPNCGSVACAAAEKTGDRVLHGERADAIAFLRTEAARFRLRNEGADAAVSAHVEILADQIERRKHVGARLREPPKVAAKEVGTPKPAKGGDWDGDCG